MLGLCKCFELNEFLVTLYDQFVNVVHVEVLGGDVGTEVRTLFCQKQEKLTVLQCLLLIPMAVLMELSENLILHRLDMEL